MAGDVVTSPRPRLTAADIVAPAVPVPAPGMAVRVRHRPRTSPLAERAALQGRPARPGLGRSLAHLPELLGLVERAAGWLGGTGAGASVTIAGGFAELGPDGVARQADRPSRIGGTLMTKRAILLVQNQSC